jgi:GNAT superfamily N-acetyltransferase
VQIAIEAATPADIPVISALLGEIEAYYGGANTPADQGQIRAALFVDPPAATLLLARSGEDVVGLASVSRLWPAAGAEASLYLKELYVRQHARRRGVAAALMTAVRETATRSGCTRVEWTADRDNPPALALYEALGFKPHQGKIFYRWEV